ncbi:MAG: hypothetical protein JO277_10625, partial [Candidatus Eremiobacteraeota bacterium]|nr:hypothetical protein [Candidatus Eremiobacteraeota bacterium]
WPAMYPTLSNYGFGFNGAGGSPGNPGGYTGSNGYDDERQQIGQTTYAQDEICH